MARARTSPQPEVPGLAARRIAADILDGVLRRRSPLDEQLSGKTAHPGLPGLADRDRALMRRLVATVLRRLGTLRHLLGGFLDKGFPADAPRAETILLIGAAQILWLEVPDHAAVDLAVRLAQADRRAARYAGLVNAVLRRVTQNRAAIDLAESDARHAALAAQALDRALRRRDRARHRHRQRSRAGARPHRQRRRRKLGRAAARPRAADRHRAHAGAGRDHAAARFQRRRLVGAGRRRRAAGASARRRRAALRSPICARRPAARPRSLRLPARASPRSTVRRRGLRGCARIFRASRSRPRPSPPTCWNGRPDRSTRVLLDAPCSATGTIRRHPDVPWLKSEADMALLIALQQKLLDRAADLLKPGGRLIYCVCSLEPEEGERQIAGLLAREPRLARQALTAAEVFGLGEFITADGDLRTLPFQLADPDPHWGGLDGFYAARLLRKTG